MTVQAELFEDATRTFRIVDDFGSRWAHERNGDQIGFAALNDGALKRYMEHCRRTLEDIEDGGSRTPRWVWEYRLRESRRVQIARFCLRMRYNARETPEGTHNYDRYMRFDQPPSYKLAAALDRERARHGMSHVLAWSDDNESGAE